MCLCDRYKMCVCAVTSSNEECVNMSSWSWPMRGVMTEVGGVMGVMAGDGPSDSRTSRSGLSNDTSSVASTTCTHTHTHRLPRYTNLNTSNHFVKRKNYRSIKSKWRVTGML